ncbi:MAG: cytochrome c [Nitrospira sp.]|nr:cytochrome c [Nitrospira sp.]
MKKPILGFGLLLWSVFAGAHQVFSGQTEKALPARAGEGKKIYVKYCAGCHGVEGKGDGYKLLGADPAVLSSPSTQKKSDAALLKTIHEGKSTMPPWKVRLSEQEGRDVLAYIRTLRQ